MIWSFLHEVNMRLAYKINCQLREVSSIFQFVNISNHKFQQKINFETRRDYMYLELMNS
jgi:hypothetical protein